MVVTSLCHAKAVDTTDNHKPSISYLDFEVMRLPSADPFQTSKETVSKNISLIGFRDEKAETVTKLAQIHNIYTSMLMSDIENDNIKYEEHLHNAINSLQKLLNTDHDIIYNKRFLYVQQLIVNEYKQFYGVDSVMYYEKGDFYAAQPDLFENISDMDMELPYIDMPTIKKTKVPLDINNQVRNHLKFYILKRPEIVEKWIERSHVYMPMIKKIFKEEKVPEELIYLCLIESGLVPRARSWAGAGGIWQFMPTTASMYGLEKNWWIDERLDPEKATRAAARHLKDLYAQWGDWHLALANYNISYKGLKRAIRYAGKEDYWEAYPYLPKETRGYIPSYIAITHIFNNLEHYGFASMDETTIASKRYAKNRYNYDVVEVHGMLPLKTIASATNIPIDELISYNPELIRNLTPSVEKYPLKIPHNSKKDFLRLYQNIEIKDYPDLTIHKVKRGETLSNIAYKYGITTKTLHQANKDIGKFIYPGNNLIIPIDRTSGKNIKANRPSNEPYRKFTQKQKTPSNSMKLIYTVKRGDTIGHIAEWYDTRAWNIRRWNNINNHIRPGQNLTIYVPKDNYSEYKHIQKLSFMEKEAIEKKQQQPQLDNKYNNHTVKRRETIIGIAKNYGISTDELRTLNNLKSSKIYPGQILKIPRK